ncbi:MAG: hypothetical protein QOJ63_1504 [Solirubrobacteraceae bacterium]|nr:hypothetical protein [Solirubrobacteraceae bacterium]
MNQKLLAIVAVAAILAIVAGAAVGRNLLSSTTTATPRADVVRFKDEISKFSIAYPGSWTRLQAAGAESDVSLLVEADRATSLIVRAAPVGLATVTQKTLPIVRKLTDSLVAADPRAKLLGAPQAVQLGGLPGYRYRYAYGSGETSGAHDHYFLFKDGRLIQLVFQAVPSTRLSALTPTFDRIAATFRGRDA